MDIKMGLRKTFTLKKAEKIFPASVTKIRGEDLIRLSIDKSKLMSDKEIKDMQSLADKMFRGFESPEMLIKRKGKKLTRIKF